jgi:hypothetical protein
VCSVSFAGWLFVGGLMLPCVLLVEGCEERERKELEDRGGRRVSAMTKGGGEEEEGGEGGKRRRRGPCTLNITQLCFLDLEGGRVVTETYPAFRKDAGGRCTGVDDPVRGPVRGRLEEFI